LGEISEVLGVRDFASYGLSCPCHQMEAPGLIRAMLRMRACSAAITLVEQPDLKAGHIWPLYGTVY